MKIEKFSRLHKIPNSPSFQKKNFFTGIYSSGKTTLANIVARSIDSPYLAYDELYNYRALVDTEELSDEKFANASNLVFKIINRYESYCMDAIPAANIVDLSNFKTYLSGRCDISITIIKCSKEVWLSRQGKGKPIAETEYDEFYYGGKAPIKSWEKLFRPHEVYYYDSGSDYFCNSLSELYDKTQD